METKDKSYAVNLRLTQQEHEQLYAVAMNRDDGKLSNFIRRAINAYVGAEILEIKSPKARTNQKEMIARLQAQVAELEAKLNEARKQA